jgi:hypothetical protein
LKDFDEKISTLNHDQFDVFIKVVTACIEGKGGLFFIDAPGGTGKTYLVNLILTYIRGLGKVAIGSALTGLRWNHCAL